MIPQQLLIKHLEQYFSENPKDITSYITTRNELKEIMYGNNAFNRELRDVNKTLGITQACPESVFFGYYVKYSRKTDKIIFTKIIDC